MDVILFETVPNLGTVGDTVKVKPGFARNYLIPHGKAVLATPENRAALELRRSELETHEAEVLSAARTKADAISGLSLQIARKAGEEGKLFGSVGTADVVEAITAKTGVEVHRHEILMPDGVLRQLGDYELELRLHPEVEVQVQVQVIAEE